MAHLDVVPVDESAPWQHPPFGAEIHDGAVWGRGTLDDKGCLVAICEAVERLLAAGFTPAQDVWLSFGSDEEVFGTAAREAVAELTRRGVEPWFVVDEGGAIAGDAFPGIKPPVGAIGVTEKGATSVVLRVEGRGGHASTPARFGPTARLARAILRVDRSPMAARIPDATVDLFRRLAPHAPLPLRPLMANAERLRPLLDQGARRGWTRVGRDDAHDLRHHDAVRIPRHQRDRVDCPGRHQHPRHGRRHRGRRDRPSPQGDQRQAGAHRRGRGVRGEPGVPRRRRRLPPHRVDGGRAVPGRRRRRRT